MSTVDYTIAYEAEGTTVDFCKIIFGADGSYFVTAPPPPHDRAIAAKITVNYTYEPGGRGIASLAEEEDVHVVDDDERRLKLSCHPSGFLQFSGEGISSGLDEGDRPKGSRNLLPASRSPNARAFVRADVLGPLAPRWREFFHRDDTGEWSFDLVHPNGQAVKRLAVVLASISSRSP